MYFNEISFFLTYISDKIITKFNILIYMAIRLGYMKFQKNKFIGWIKISFNLLPSASSKF